MLSPRVGPVAVELLFRPRNALPLARFRGALALVGKPFAFVGTDLAFIREQATQGGDDPDELVSRLMGDPATLTALRIDLRLQKALDIVVDNAKEITPEQAEAREKLWTPEKESEAAAAKPTTIWTPGSAEPGE